MSSPTYEDNTETEPIDVDECQIPPKSRHKYMKAYANFIRWKKVKKAESFSETVFLDYFQALAKDRVPATLWSTYSMLKTTVRMKNNINLRTFKKLTEYLRTMAKGHKSTKSNVLTREQVKTFLNEAPDKDYLLPKVALVIGLEGSCRGNELIKLSTDDIEKKEDLLFVKMIDSKTNEDKSFTIRAEYRKIVEKYLDLRPDDMETKRFFIRYRYGKCMKQVIGKNRFSVIAQEIASYLKLPDALFYTGHCFRRTAAMLAKPEGDKSVAKQLEEQTSGTKAKEKTEEQIKDCTKEKTEITSSADENVKLDSAKSSTSAMSPRPSTSKHEPSPPLQKEQTSNESDSKAQTKNNTTSDSVSNKTVKDVSNIV